MASTQSTPATRFHVMAKPVGPLCNLDCSYCFYLHKQNLLETTSRWRMPDEVLEEFIRQYITGQNHDEIIFSWQGEEPTLRGLDFYEKVVSLQKKHNPDGKLIQNDLQTSGVLLDEAWCRFLRRHNFLVGLSIDGPKDLNDKHRRDHGGGGSFDKVAGAAFIGGTVPLRTGMTKVGLPGAKEGWQESDITIAAVLKEQGCATGQFGKNHFGDRDEYLPTNHGFDEFFGNLYHLNAEEEPEHRDYPGDLVLPSGNEYHDGMVEHDMHVGLLLVCLAVVSEAGALPET